MKKFFTLLAVAAMAMTAGAQELTWKVAADFTAVDNESVALDTNCPMSFTADGKWAAPKSDQFGTAEAFPELTCSLQGGNNPKFDKLGYKKDDNFNIPNTGCGYIFSPKADGTLTIYAKLAGGKPSRIVTGEAYAKFDAVHADGTPCDWFADLTYGVDGNGQCILTVDAVKDTRYCLVTDGSKATIYGYNFVAGSGTVGIENVAIDENAPVEYFNLQGIRVANPENGLYIRRQGSKVSKVIL